MRLPELFLRAMAGLRRLALLGACLAGGASALSAQFTVDELELHVVPDGSGALVRVFPIRSTLDSTQQIQLSVMDWQRDSLGANVFQPFGTHPASCKDKLDVFPLTLQLAPGAVEYVRVTYTGRQLPDPGCWALIVAERVRPPVAAPQGASVNINMRTGVKLYVHASDETPRGEVISADVESGFDRTSATDSTFYRQVAVRFANTGTAHLRMQVQLEIRDVSTQLVARVPGPEVYLTPEAFRDILVRLPATLPRGRYVAVMLLDYGADEITAAQVEFEIP